MSALVCAMQFMSVTALLLYVFFYYFFWQPLCPSQNSLGTNEVILNLESKGCLLINEHLFLCGLLSLKPRSFLLPPPLHNPNPLPSPTPPPPPPTGCGKAILSASVRCSLVGIDTEKIDECFDMESVRQTLLSGPPL